jgi:maltose/moltooligosaccharide transporter
MEPFRALVADQLPEKQRSYGFVMQTLIIGIGTWIASNLPWFLTKVGLEEDPSEQGIPLNVKVAFAIGALVFLASIIYTVVKTKEYPPENEELLELEKKNSSFFKDFFQSISSMSSNMLKLGLIQFFSWFAFFTMWSMATPALTEHVFHAPAPNKSEYNLEISSEKIAFEKLNGVYQHAADQVGSDMGVYGLSSMAFALLIVFYSAKRSVNRKLIHLSSLILGGFGFILMKFIPDPSYLWICFTLIGISWGSILSMPYAMLSSSVDSKKMGLMMGLFNMFIVIPQICAALGGINFFAQFFGSDAIAPMMLAGSALLIAGFCNLFITDQQAIHG